MMRTQSLLLALLFPLVAAAGVPSEDEVLPLDGGWVPIQNINDPFVQDIAKWAVSKYNQQFHKALVLQSVLHGQEQVVAGMNYRLLITFMDGSSTANYEGLVYDGPWDKFRELTSFVKK